MAISIRVEDDKAYISSPFNSDFIDKIHSIGSAKWERQLRAWSVPVTELDSVKGMLREVYGTDGSENIENKVNIKLTTDDDVDLDDIQEDPMTMTLFGREIMRAYSRDSGVKVAPDVTVVGDYGSGGSRNHPTIWFGKGAEIYIYKVPESLAKKAKVPHMTVEIISEPEVDRQALLDEKKKLLKRLDEIEKLLQNG